MDLPAACHAGVFGKAFYSKLTNGGMEQSGVSAMARRHLRCGWSNCNGNDGRLARSRSGSWSGRRKTWFNWRRRGGHWFCDAFLRRNCRPVQFVSQLQNSDANHVAMKQSARLNSLAVDECAIGGMKIV